VPLLNGKTTPEDFDVDPAGKPEGQHSNEPDNGDVHPAQLWKLVLEAGPLVIFFIANSYHGIFYATGAFMIATVLSLAVSKAKFGRIPIMPLVSGVFVLVFGALTLYLQEDFFIKIKPTIVNLLFAAILFGGLFAGHSLLRHLFGEVFHLTDRGWRLLTFRWACFFVFLAILNEIVWRNFSTDFWAGFKLMGVMPITMIFAIAQLGLIQRYDASRSDASEERSSS
jgi:intracellular septation protein